MILDKEDVKYIVIKLRKQVRRSTARMAWFYISSMRKSLKLKIKPYEISVFPWIQYAVRNLCRPSYEIKD